MKWRIVLKPRRGKRAYCCACEREHRAVFLTHDFSSRPRRFKTREEARLQARALNQNTTRGSYRDWLYVPRKESK